MDGPVAELLAKLSDRPGRGGVKLSYEQAQLALRLIARGAQAAADLATIHNREPLADVLVEKADVAAHKPRRDPFRR